MLQLLIIVANWRTSGTIMLYFRLLIFDYLFSITLFFLLIIELHLLIFDYALFSILRASGELPNVLIIVFI